MNPFHFFLFLISLVSFHFPIFCLSEQSTSTSDELPTIVIELEKPHRKITDPHFSPLPSQLKPEMSDEKKIWFKFKDEPLTKVVTYVADALKISIVLPQGAEALTGKITIDYPEKVTPQAAYEKILSLLRIAGYNIIPQNNFYYIVKNAQAFKTNPYPFYVNTNPEDLPDTDDVIRYMYYFTNLQISQQSGTSPLQKLLHDTMSESSISGGVPVIFDSTTNGMLLTYFSRSIKSIMELIVQLDTYGFTDTIELIPLKHVNSNTIANLFKSLLQVNEPSSGSSPSSTNTHLSPQSHLSPSHYFSQTTRIATEPRSNSLIVMGKKEAVNRFKDFTKKYLDIPLDEGASVIHIYPLQYLNAISFAPILQQIVNSQAAGAASSGTTSQSTGSQMGEGKQFFNGVIINAEPITQTNAIAIPTTPGGGFGSGATATAPSAAQQGGNRLIIAANKEDWTRLKKLISDLDKPQTQIALEILVIDLTAIEDDFLGSQVRNKANMLPPGVNVQTSTLSGGIELSGTTNNYPYNALMANLLQPFLTNPSANMATSMGGGSFVLSLNDPASASSGQSSVAWVLQLLKNYANTRILSHPFTVVLNNQTALFTSQETRLLPGAASNKKGTVFAPIVPVSSSLAVGVTPLVNGEKFINLGINIQINEFQPGSSNAQNTRQIVTNANIKDGQVLVLGGLTQTSIRNIELGVPVLKDIPIVGWLFKSVQKSTLKTNLAIFICPKIVASSNGYCDSFTVSKLVLAGESVDPAASLARLRDPITRWFFENPNDNDSTKMLRNFMERRSFINTADYREEETKTAEVEIIKQNPKPPMPSVEQDELKRLFSEFDTSKQPSITT